MLFKTYNNTSISTGNEEVISTETIAGVLVKYGKDFVIVEDKIFFN